MRPLVPLLTATMLLTACSAPSDRFIPITGGSGVAAQSASDGYIMSKDSQVDDIANFLQAYTDSNGYIITKRLPISPDATASSDTNPDMNGDGEISIYEALYRIKSGVLAVSNVDGRPTIVVASGPGGSSQFGILTKERDYYASNPNNGLGMSGNAAKVAALNEVLIQQAYSEADSDSVNTSDLKLMRSYYNDLRNPPFDGLGDAARAQHLVKIEGLLFKIGVNHASISVLTELRDFFGTNPNDGLGIGGHDQAIQNISAAIDKIAEGVDVKNLSLFNNSL